ncbi:hypothetical protein [Nocardioides stalactiti]|uniref:hypothetical protein n=1 Tax=Nocardioides stalactiti TaxID=2755356 RepID=UPI0016044156|nr:hypothetical protein [Nocardioides stalactiti]
MTAQVGQAESALRTAIDGRCAFQVTRDAADAALSAELARWLAPEGTDVGVGPEGVVDPLGLARLVVQEIRVVGQHFLTPERLAALAAVRDRYDGRDPYLDSFLECVLDKHDGRYWNRTYLSIPVLDVILGENPLLPSGLAALLAADIVRYELCAAHRRTPVSPLGRPDARTLRTRLRHSLRFMNAHLGSAVSDDLLGAIARDPEADLPALLLDLPPALAAAGDWLELSMQPVSTVHDEYFFIRVLQAHEMAFAGMCWRTRDTIAALRDGQLDAADRLLAQVVTFMDRNASLFRIVATLRYEAFHTFREFTDGASAVQSETYKRFEGLCGRPPSARLTSPAFESVPDVRGEVVSGQDTLSDAYRDAALADPGSAQVTRIAERLRALEASHHRWKATHVTLATRMLGDARGSGYTAGVGYLSQWVDHRLFWQLPA